MKNKLVMLRLALYFILLAINLFAITLPGNYLIFKIANVILACASLVLIINETSNFER